MSNPDERFSGILGVTLPDGEHRSCGCWGIWAPAAGPRSGTLYVRSGDAAVAGTPGVAISLCDDTYGITFAGFTPVDGEWLALPFTLGEPSPLSRDSPEAYHVAGHLVACVLLGMTFDTADLGLADDLLVTPACIEGISDRGEEVALREIQVTFAGSIAPAMYHPELIDAVTIADAAHDAEARVMIASALYGSHWARLAELPADMAAEVERVRSAALRASVDLIAPYVAAIRSVAATVATGKPIDCATVAAIIDTHPPELYPPEKYTPDRFRDQ